VPRARTSRKRRRDDDGASARRDARGASPAVRRAASLPNRRRRAPRLRKPPARRRRARSGRVVRRVDGGAAAITGGSGALPFPVSSGSFLAHGAWRGTATGRRFRASGAWVALKFHPQRRGQACGRGAGNAAHPLAAQASSTGFVPRSGRRGKPPQTASGQRRPRNSRDRARRVGRRSPLTRPGAVRRPWGPPPRRASTGAAPAASPGPSAASRPPGPRSAAAPRRDGSAWRRDSNPSGSEGSGAVRAVPWAAAKAGRSRAGPCRSPRAAGSCRAGAPM
jgi:hypothetical protein